MIQNNKITDLSYLQEMSGNDSSIIKEMIVIFIEQIPEFEHDFTTAFETQDWNALGAIAHKAKSSVRTMGMDEMGDKLEQLEHFSKGNAKYYLQQKLNKNENLSLEEEKIWRNISHETKHDIDLLFIPNLTSNFLEQCPLVIKELKEILKTL